jgi:hypothetical protein
MRYTFVLAVLMLAGCATTKSVAPREYLDEQTAATITVVADPWIFTRKNAAPQLDFFHLYAIDVNRMGDHKKYFAIVHYWPSEEIAASGAPVLVLRGGSRELKLEPVPQTPRQLGIAQPLDKSAPASAQTWLYPVDSGSLQAIAQSRQLAASLLTSKGGDAAYAVWRDGSTELSEFAISFE